MCAEPSPAHPHDSSARSHNSHMVKSSDSTAVVGCISDHRAWLRTFCKKRYHFPPLTIGEPQLLLWKWSPASGAWVFTSARTSLGATRLVVLLRTVTSASISSGDRGKWDLEAQSCPLLVHHCLAWQPLCCREQGNDSSTEDWKQLPSDHWDLQPDARRGPLA